MEHASAQIGFALLYLAANIIILQAILMANKPVASSKKNTMSSERQSTDATRSLNASEVLQWEFEYARTTASEAMQDRHTMINFYLLAAGIVASGVVAVLSAETSVPYQIGTVLLWLLCGVGWLYFLKIVRLRQAWYDSALAMNTIKSFYLQHCEHFTQEQLETAFRWRTDSLPAPGKRWTVFFYSAMLIAYLDTAAYVAGAVLIDVDAATSRPWTVLLSLSVFGLVFFSYHVWLYEKFLKS